MKTHDNMQETQQRYVPARFASDSSHSSIGRKASEKALWPHPVQHENINVKHEQPHDPTAKNASKESERPVKRKVPTLIDAEESPPAIVVAPLTKPMMSDAIATSEIPKRCKVVYIRTLSR